MNRLRDYARQYIADAPTEKAPAIPTFAPVLVGTFATEARSMLLPGESPEALVIRLMLFYQHANRQESDTSLVAALTRITEH